MSSVDAALDGEMLTFVRELGRRYGRSENETIRDIVARAASAGDPIALVLAGPYPASLAGLQLKEWVLRTCYEALSPERQAGAGQDFRLACAGGRAIVDVELKEIEELRQKAVALKLTFEAALLERVQEDVGLKDPNWHWFWSEQRAALARLRTLRNTTRQ
ncbi:MAG TPA: hypothetical protein VG758_28770 [Hyphomicrobiaceae bacterium]|jgi:hypothetical protein|nr:hypothetical protein [Hyphomicrobiaceae bacterium]